MNVSRQYLVRLLVEKKILTKTGNRRRRAWTTCSPSRRTVIAIDAPEGASSRGLLEELLERLAQVAPEVVEAVQGHVARR